MFTKKTSSAPVTTAERPMQAAPAPVAPVPVRTEAPRAEQGILLGTGSVLKGSMDVQGDAKIDGVVEGNCTCTGKLVLGKHGEIKGNIQAKNVSIAGLVEGNVVCKGKLELLATGKLTGDVIARALVVAEDAYFEGKCTMTTGAKAAEDDKEQETIEETAVPEKEEAALKEDELEEDDEESEQWRDAQLEAIRKSEAL